MFTPDSSRLCLSALCGRSFFSNVYLTCSKLLLFLIFKNKWLSETLYDSGRTVQLPFNLGGELLGRVSVGLVSFKSVPFSLPLDDFSGEDRTTVKLVPLGVMVALCVDFNLKANVFQKN